MRLKRRSICLSHFFTVSLFLLSTCSGGGALPQNSIPAPTLRNISDLPLATSPVEASTSALKRIIAVATTGISLGEDTMEDDFEDKSYGACEMINQSRGALGVASIGDMVLCFMKAFLGENTDILDGNYHVFDMATADGSPFEGPNHIKLKVVKTGDTITEFEMFACTDGQQDQYLKQTISGNDFTMLDIGLNIQGGGGNDHRAHVTGTLNENAKFTGTKTIDMSFINDFSNNFGEGSGNYSVATMEQGADSLTYSGFSQDFGFAEHSTTIYSVMELLDFNEADTDNYDLNLLALGDGAAEIIADVENSYTQGWSGDTYDVDPDAAELNALEGHDPPSIDPNPPTIALTADQQYDCSDTAEMTITVDEAVFDSTCSGLLLNQDDHLECHQVANTGTHPDSREPGEEDDLEEEESITSNCNSSPSSSDPVNGTTLEGLCDCNGLETSECTTMSSLCSDLNTIQDCINTVNEFLEDES